MPEETNSHPSEAGAELRELQEFIDFPFPTFYTNAMKVTSSYFDFQLLVMDRMSKDLGTIRARIVMSPSHAKLLAGALITQLQQWEQQFGEINTGVVIRPPSSTEPEPQP